MRNTGTSRRGVSVRRGEVSAQRTEGFPSCARRPDRRQSVQPPLARQHLCRPPRRSPFQALRILWAQPEQRAYLYTLTEHLKEYEWL